MDRVVGACADRFEKRVFFQLRAAGNRASSGGGTGGRFFFPL